MRFLFIFRNFLSASIYFIPYFTVRNFNAISSYTARTIHPNCFSKNNDVIGKRIKLLLILAPAGGQPFTRAIRFRAVGEHAIFIRRYYPI